MHYIIIRIISLILLILTFVQIFMFSNQTGEESGSLSEIVTRTIIDLLPNTKNKSEEIKSELVEKVQPIIRKLAHFSMYTLVGIFSMTFVSTYSLKTKNRFSISILIGIIYAITDELHQKFSPDRSPAILDVVIDTAGTAFGTILVFFAISLYKRIKSKNINSI